MMQTIWSLSGVLSPAIAATIIGLPALARQGVITGVAGSALARLQDGAPLAISIDAITFFAAAATLLFLFIPSPKRTDIAATTASRRRASGPTSRRGRSTSGIAGRMLWLLGTFTVANFVGAPTGVFQPLIVKFNLAADWTAHGLQL